MIAYPGFFNSLLGLQTELHELGSSSNDGFWKLINSNGDVLFFDETGLPLRVEFIEGGFIDYQWSAQGLVSKTDHKGRSLIYNYDINNRLQSIILPDGNVIFYEYDTDPLLLGFYSVKKVVWPDGKYIEYLYDEPQYRDASSANPILLTGKKDAKGERIGTYTYSNGKAVSSSGALGIDEKTFQFFTDFTYVKDANNNQVAHFFQTTLGDGTVAPSRTTQPAGSGSASASSFVQYFPDGLVSERKDYNGNKTLYDYDHTRGLQTVLVTGIGGTDAANYRANGVSLPQGAAKITTEWHSNWRMPVRVAEPERLTTYIYNGDQDPFNGNAIASCSSATHNGNPMPLVCRQVYQATTDSNGSIGLSALIDSTVPEWHFLYNYNSRGEITRIVRPPSNLIVLSVEYYESASSGWSIGDIKQLTNALGHQINFLQYNKNGYPLRVIDANNVETIYQYDEGNRVIGRTTGNVTTNYSYDPNGNLKTYTLPNQTTFTYEYDEAQRLIAIVDEEGGKIEYQLDLEGNLLFETITDSDNILMYSKGQVFDALNRIEEVLGSSGNNFSITYDANGNLKSKTNAQNNSTTYNYNKRNALISSTDSLNEDVVITYDGMHRIKTLTDQNDLVTTYQYDGLGNLMQVTSPDSGITTYTYDAAGNRTRQTDARGVVTQYQYDALNRLTHVLYPASPQENVTYSYDDTGNGNHGIGRLTGLRDASGITAYYYNALGQLTERHQLLEGLFYRWGFGYDLAGNLTSLRYPSGRTVTYSRNALGQIDGIITADWEGASSYPLADNMQYRPFGPLHQFDYGSGVTHTVSHDLDYRINGVTDTAGGVDLHDKMLSYYNTGNVEDITDSLNSANNQLFTYDPENRLDTATGVYGALNYDYDAAGNRIQQRIDTNNDGTDDIVELYSYLNPLTATRTDNRLHQVAINSTTYAFDYDEAGSLLQDNRNNQSFTYNAAGRMATMNDATANAGDYRYNGLGQRVIKLATHASLDHHHYHYAPDGKLLAITAGSDGRAIAEYVYLDDLRLAQLSPDAASDTDNDGMDDDWEIQHFGNTTTSSGSSTDDADGDGVLDIVEFIGGTDPSNTTTSDSDTDGDTLPDTWEYLHFGNLQQDATTDYDSDGLSDGKEYQLQYDPTRNSLTWLVPFLYH